MAASLTLSVTPTVVDNNQLIQCTATIGAGPGQSAISVVSVAPYGFGTSGPGGVQMSEVGNVIGSTRLLSPSATVAASLVFQWSAICFAAPAPLNPPYPSTPAYDPYTLGVNVTMSDGTVLTASTTVFVYPLVLNAASNTAMPGNGALRFDQNTESALIGALYQP